MSLFHLPLHLPNMSMIIDLGLKLQVTEVEKKTIFRYIIYICTVPHQGPKGLWIPAFLCFETVQLLALPVLLLLQCCILHL